MQISKRFLDFLLLCCTVYHAADLIVSGVSLLFEVGGYGINSTVDDFLLFRNLHTVTSL